MNVLIAPDSFKDCLPADQVAEAIKQGVLGYSPESECFYLPASDGGEGFLKAVHSYVPNSEWVTVSTVDPLHRPIHAKYLFVEETASAYIELAATSGLELLLPRERNPLQTSTYGTGLLVKHAIEQGARNIYVGLGGSATNDGGMGIATALGYEFLDQHGNTLKSCGYHLQNIHSIHKPNRDQEIQVFAVNDVNNPLFGDHGAAYTYARQKGASDAEIRELDKGLIHLDRKVVETLGEKEGTTPGAGAAGGTAYGLKVFLNANFIDGTSFLLKLAKFDELIRAREIDLIITGEGKIDEQTAHGKFVYGLTQNARSYQIPVIAICGKLNLTVEGVKSMGLHSAFEIYDAEKSADYSYTFASRLITEQTKRALSLVTLPPER